jgi:hypothetical protein
VFRPPLFVEENDADRSFSTAFSRQQGGQEPLGLVGVGVGQENGLAPGPAASEDENIRIGGRPGEPWSIGREPLDADDTRTQDDGHVETTVTQKRQSSGHGEDSGERRQPDLRCRLSPHRTRPLFPSEEPQDKRDRDQEME